MKTMPANRPGIPIPVAAPQPAPQAAMPTPLPQHMQPIGVNSGELGLPWHHTFGSQPPQQPMKKPVEPNQGVAGGVGAAGALPGLGL